MTRKKLPKLGPCLRESDRLRRIVLPSTATPEGQRLSQALVQEGRSLVAAPRFRHFQHPES